MMDGNSCKRNRRTYNNKEEENAQFCNRIGCNGRLKYSNTNPRPSPQLEPLSRSLRVAKVTPASGRTHSGQLQPNKREGSGSSCAQRKDMHKPQSGSSVSSRDSSTGSISRSLGSGSRYGLRSLGSSVSSGDSSTGSISRSSGSGSRYGLRSLNCSSISDVVPRGGGSSSESKNRRELLKKRVPEEGESSAPSRGKSSSVAPSKDDHASSSRRNRKVSDHDSSTSPVMTRRPGRSVNADAGVMRSNRDSIPVTGFKSIIPRSPRPQVRNNANRSVPYRSSLGASYSSSSSYAPEQVGNDVPSIERLRSSEHSVAQGLRRHNLNGAAEVLFALERLEQEEELTYEQLLSLENNLFFGNNLYFYDQHRDMRLDIDNMSYEELLSLEDRMGSVSTALSEDAFTKCVKRTIYQTTSLEVNMGGDEDEAESKCSICQEEYAIGDEIGRLGCEHGYHVGCLQQWLQLKNWCPVCKAAAAP